ncbi:hypothetical protein G7Y79_00013g034860 [Physcia stellaris]|nr:hypothetical protein G7Y79_00013g034860 [Physcia stellaris]
MSSHNRSQPYNSPPSPFIPNTSTPPQPPPKPSQSSLPQSQNTGPPLPPPPPTPSTPGSLQQGPQASLPPPPDPAEHWLPSNNPTPTPPLPHLPTPPPPRPRAHPPLPAPLPLTPYLTHTTTLASHLQTRHAHLLHLRSRTADQLLRLHALERAWRAKQAALDRELEPWSAKELYRRLVKGEREAEEVSAGLEGSWFESSSGREGAGEEEGLGEGARRGRWGRW